MLVHMFAKSGSVFRGGGDVLDLDAVDAQTKHCGERRHAMVRVGFHFGGLEIRCRHWHDLQPSGSSRASPPTLVISLTNASRRFVSWPRKWPMPSMRVGCRAKTKIAASDGAISPAAVRSKITQAVDMAAAGHFAVPDASITGKLISAPICSKYPGSRPPGWVVDSGQ